MTNYELLLDLCESQLIPSRNSLKKWDESTLSEVTYLYFLALRVLLHDHETKKWALHYAEKTSQGNNFNTWRTDGNDFYILLYALSSDDAEFRNAKRSISSSVVRDWLHHAKGDNFDARTHQLFNRLDAMFRITNTTVKTMRRSVMHWGEIGSRERENTLVKLIHQIKKLAPRSELLSHLKKITKQYDDDDDDDDDRISETASSGATGSANVATVASGLGSGFNAAGQGLEKSIYRNKSRPSLGDARRERKD